MARARAASLGAAADALTPALRARHDGRPGARVAWRGAASALVDVTGAGVPALGLAAARRAGAPPSRASSEGGDGGDDAPLPTTADADAALAALAGAYRELLAGPPPRGCR